MEVNTRKDKVFLWRTVQLYGIGSRSWKKLRIITAQILCWYMFTQAIIASVKQWDDQKIRFEALEDVDLHLYCLLCIMEYTFYPKLLFSSLNIIDEDYFSYGGRMTESREELLKKCKNDLKNELNNYITVLIIYEINYFAVPFFMMVIKFLTKGPNEDIPYNHLFPSESWLPFEIKSFYIYLLVYSYQLIYCMFIYHNTSAYLGTAIGSQRKLTSEIKLLSLAFKEIDKSQYIYGERIEGTHYQTQRYSEQERLLYKYLGRIVEHHQHINKNLKSINKALSIISLNVNQAASLLCCLSLYCMLEFDEMVYKIKYAVSIVDVALIVLYFCYNGQVIQDEAEDLRFQIYNSNWLDKPLWFRKSLLQIMTRTNRVLEVKPMGLYTMNFNYFMTIMNAAYAYCNFLRTSKLKTREARN